jgi:DNA-binding MarR family transcriptional regulator
MPLDDSSADLAAGLLNVLPRLHRRLRADLPQAPRGADEAADWQKLMELRGASGQVALMGLLVKRERATMQDIATYLAVTPATVTMMVKRLLAQGYVERLRVESDWRVVWVHPTELGRRVMGYYAQEREASLLRRLAHLNDEEQEQIRAALPALHHLIEVDL